MHPVHQPDGMQNIKTRLVHEGEHGERRPGGVPTALPIYTSSTYIHPDTASLDNAFNARSGDSQYVYARFGNPNTAGLEAVMTAAEGGRGAVACSSGMSALYLALLAAGTPRGSIEPHARHILASQDLYGATHTLLRDFFSAQNVPVSYCDPTDLAALRSAVQSHEPDVVLIESMSNPLLRIADIQAIAEIVHQMDARLIVDATMTTPILHQPLTQGADIVVHSATKYLGGHADVTGGIVVAANGMMVDVAQRYARLLGTCLGPFEARLVSRGIKTLALRVREQCVNAAQIAQRLSAQPGISSVIYPGLPTHPQHELAGRQFHGLYGAMISFELRNADRQAVFRFMDNLKLILPATSLGDIYTLITYPAISSHRDMSEETRHTRGINDNLVRLSVGIEDAGDIIADLDQALQNSY